MHHIVQSLHHQLHTLPPAETVDLNPISQSLAHLTHQFDNRPEPEQIQDLREDIASLPHALELEKAIATQVEETALVLALDINDRLHLSNLMSIGWRLTALAAALC